MDARGSRRGNIRQEGEVTLKSFQMSQQMSVGVRMVMADSAIQNQNIIERAYQLARSGEFASVGEIKERLKTEGYSSIPLHFSGKSLQRSLLQLCSDSRAARA